MEVVREKTGLCIMAVVCCTVQCDADAVLRWGTGGFPHQPEPCPLSKSLVRAVVKPVLTAIRWAFLEVEVVYLIVLASVARVLRATTKKGQLFCLAPQYFPLEPPLM